MEILNFLIDEMSVSGLIVSFAAFFLGFRYPDWDFKFKLKHRSILTHSPLIMILFFKLYEYEKSDDFRYFIMGFSLALALHFLYDLFPKGWQGGAVLKIPIVNRSLSSGWSIFSFIIFITVSMSITINYTQNMTEFIYLLFIGVFTLFTNVKREGKLIRPFVSFVGFYLVVGAAKYDIIFRYFVQGILPLQKALLGAWVHLP